MAFPATPLDVEVSLALSADLSDPGSWSWTDITDYVRENHRIRIRRGRSSERSTIGPSRCTLTVDNSDGRFCRFLPTGAWYGQIGKNTPLRVRVNNGSGYVTRFVGYVSGWPPSWDPSESDQTVSLTADGILRRLGQGRVLRPSLERAILADGPAQFWPLNDGDESTRAASALSGGVTMATYETVAFGSVDGPAGAPGPLADVSAGGFTASFPPVTGTGWTLELIGKVTEAPDPVDLMYRLFFSNAITTLSDDSEIIPNDGEWHHYLISEEQVGSDVNRQRWVDGVQDLDVTLPATTHRYPYKMIVNIQPPDLSPLHIGFMAIHPHADVDAASRYQAMLGHIGEQAHERVERLCAEEGVPVAVTATSSQAMGAQRPNALVALLRECATTDFGLLYEPADAAGLAYLSSTERYNQAAAITLQYDQGHIAPPWDPTDDDRDTRNDVTASRSGGGSARVTDETSIAAIGLYDDTISANTEDDDQLNDIAGWAVNLGAVDELRWPAVRPNLMAHPSLIDAWMSGDIGSQLHVTGHPSPLAPDEIKQIIEGYDETVGSYEYTAVANLSPASGWVVAELDDDDLGKLDTDGSELITAVNSSATTLTVLTTNVDSPLWTTDSGEMPIPLIVAGEVMSVTGVASVATEAFGGTTANGWGSADTGQAWTTSGGAAADYAVAGGVGTISVSATGTDRWVTLDVGSVDADVTVVLETNTTPTGGATQYGVGARFTDASNYYLGIASVSTAGVVTLSVRKRVAGAATTLSSLVTPLLIGTNVVLRFRVIGSSLRLEGWAQSNPAQVWTVDVADTDLTTGTQAGCFARRDAGNLTPTSFAFDLFAVANPQIMTVTRSVNGVAKSQSAGAAVNVYRPARLAL